ncbi:hypothetical protein B0J14DRAFT_49095 [Halenospora varia]|nr:hypothetical protein B0J14DRAFT_49095 [Halenospora varia]
MHLEPTGKHGSQNAACIEVRPMFNRPELRDKTEDWTGKTSTAMRRKLQNRLNQRASRRRKAQAEALFSEDQSRNIPQRDVRSENIPSPKPIFLQAIDDIPSEVCINTPKRQAILRAQSFSSFVRYPLPTDQKLLTLLHFNLIRALTQNIRILGLNPDHMNRDIPSIFHSNSQISSSQLPPDLQPTAFQLTIPHHPEIDVFPCPQWRNNMLLAKTSNTDDIGFCQDLVYGVEDHAGDSRQRTDCMDGSFTGRTGMLVWGDPWLISSWEVEPAFARKYKWLIAGCEELVRSTNCWRMRRGEDPVDLGD